MKNISASVLHCVTVTLAIISCAPFLVCAKDFEIKIWSEETFVPHGDLSHAVYKFVAEPSDPSRDTAPIQPFTVIALAIDPSFTLGVEVSQGPNGISVDSVTREGPSPVVAVAGGFLASFSPLEPVGLVKVDGIIHNDAVNPTTDDILETILCFKDNNVDFFSWSDLEGDRQEDFSAMLDCIQVGPRIVVGGLSVNHDFLDESDENKSDVYQRFWTRSTSRGFLATDNLGRVFFGITTPTPLKELAHALLSAFSDKWNVEIVDVVHLHGASSAGLKSVRGPDDSYQAGSSSAPQGTVIRARRNETGE